MTKKLIFPESVAVKDDTGAYTKIPVSRPEEPKETPAVDDLIAAGLQNMAGAMRAITADIGTGAPSRETIMNLKDVMSLLWEHKKREKEFLDKLTDEDIEKLSNK